MADHVWVAPPLTRGPRKGQPSSQRQCTQCGIWETELSRAKPCPTAGSAGSDWRAVAGQLAARLRPYAHCRTHSLDYPGPDCPHCADRAAWLDWAYASGLPVAGPERGGAQAVIDLLQPKDGGGDG